MRILKATLLLPLVVAFYLTENPPVARAANGCGDDTITGHLVPNNPTGASFQHACNNHDNCYDTLGTPKSVCDKKFHEEMLEECARTYKTIINTLQRKECNGVADVYYTAVLERGGSPYRQAQEKAQARANKEQEQYENEVRQIYRQVLGREADADGLQHHINILRSGEQTYEQVRAGIASGQESRNNINNLYLQYLGRNADPEGMEHHVNLLGSGQMTFEQIRNGIANSEEAKNRGR